MATIRFGNINIRISRVRPKRRVQKSVGVATSIAPFYQAVLYIGDGTLGAHHIYRQWRDTFASSGVIFIAIFRNFRVYEQAKAEFPDDAIIYVGSADDLVREMQKLSGVSACYYTGNTGNNVHMLVNGAIRHIFIGHGDSDKATSATRAFRVFDEIWVAGQAHIDRLQRIPGDWSFRIVGRPQSLPLLDKARRNTGTPQFCYLPTWEGAGNSPAVSSLAIAADIVNTVAKKASVKTKFHPSTGFRIREYLKLEAHFNELGFDVVRRAEQVIDIMTDADFCIADISSVVSDWLVSKKPIFVYVPEHMRGSSEELPLLRYSYAYSSTDELGTLVDNVLNGVDPLLKEREDASEYLVSSSATREKEFNKALVENALIATKAEQRLASI